MEDDILKLDLYQIIGADITADEAEIRKAYRKKALACHPDKNKDNPKAVELFLQLSKALEVLTDTAARTAYDNIIKRRIQKELEKKQSSAKRRKIIDDLEAREEAFKQSQSTGYAAAKSDEEKLKAEIERLKKEGSRLVEQEKELLRQQILKDLTGTSSSNIYGENGCKVKLKWKVSADDDGNGGYNYDNLHAFLSKYGTISGLAISTKKGRALVEFETHEAAKSAVDIEIGLITNPLKLDGMWKDVKTSGPAQNKPSTMFIGASLFPSTGGATSAKRRQVPQGLSCSSVPDIFNTQPQSDADFEAAVLNNLRREEERRKLIEQMKAEDAGT